MRERERERARAGKGREEEDGGGVPADDIKNEQLHTAEKAGRKNNGLWGPINLFTS